jgi:hypothetical protein
MNEDDDDALRSALRREAYRPEVRLDGDVLRSRLEVDDRRRHDRHRRRQVSFAGLAIVAAVALAVWSSAVSHLSVGPAASAACGVSLPTTHGTWWVEIGGPHAYFNVEPGTLYATDSAWLITTRFDPDAAAGQDISMWAEAVPSGQRVDAAFDSRMDPTNIYRFSSPAPSLPGGWYLFGQRIPSAGCWRLVASVGGEIVGSAVLEVRSGAASARPTASVAAPTPRLAHPSSSGSTSSP